MEANSYKFQFHQKTQISLEMTLICEEDQTTQFKSEYAFSFMIYIFFIYFNLWTVDVTY